MKMKEIRYILTIMVLVTFAGCTKTEFVPDVNNEVMFTVGNYAPQTKVDPVTEFTSFKSKGYLYAEGVAGVQNFFGADGETISYDGVSQWAPNHPYYWPKGESSYINFVSWHAYDGSADIVPDTVSETAFEIAGRTIGANDNILIADVAWHQTSNQNQYYTVGVPTLFHHLLSRVEINVKATTLTDPVISGVTYEVAVESARLEKVYQRGTLSLVNEEPSSAGTTEWHSTASPDLLWTSVAGSNAANIEFAGLPVSIPAQPAAAAILPERSFLPQVLGDNVKLVLTYSVTTKSNGVATSTESGIPATLELNKIKNVSNDRINQWIPNKRYIYNIVINPVGNEILLNPVIESDWSVYNTFIATVE